ncbi:MAG: NAD(+) synthase, partial [Bdellovibrionales bacterium]|nr:NAD(+) synthase [Bdellovibrionales bacterium]
ESSYFIEDLNIADFKNHQGGRRSLPEKEVEFLHQGLVLGIRDFLGKTGFQKAHLGLSGGIDSAVVACLAADAIGPNNLTVVALPTQFNSPESYSSAEQLAKNLGCDFKEIEIQTSFDEVVRAYEMGMGARDFSLMHENIQARLRGLMLMAISNDKGSFLLSTGNKSEYAAGYTTLYGDMCGGLAPLGDLLKKQVYDLANYYNSQTEIIPQFIIEREPSAELRPNQKDVDSLPPYDDLDKAVDRLVCNRNKPRGEVEKWLLNRLMHSEFKRWQAPPILKVSTHAFGQGRRMPIAHRGVY